MLPPRPTRIAKSSISNVETLCSALEITQDEYEEASWLDEEKKYTAQCIQKADGTLRTVHSPHRLIRRIQRRINRRIFSVDSVLSWPPFVFGSLPNQYDDDQVYAKDYIACARVHCGAKSLLKLDIKDFFDNIGQDLVEEIFLKVFKYPLEVSRALANICCFDGRVVQGALTSSYLACLCLHDVEGNVVHRLANKNLSYTRYVDDITVSSKSGATSFDYAISIIKAMLESKDLPLNIAKTKIQRMSTEPLTVHGLRISFSEPRLPADEVRRIRAGVKNVENLARESNYRTSHSYRHDFNRCMGRVNKLGRVGHKQHKPFVKRLRAVIPLPSLKDIKRIDLMVTNLERDYAQKQSTYRYACRFYLAHERTNVLHRSFPIEARLYRDRLKLIRTTHV